MLKEAEIRNKIDDCEARITEQVKRRTNRDKDIIRKCQSEHAKLTLDLASVLKDNREETIDEKDESGEKYRVQQEQKSKDKREEFEKERIELEETAKLQLAAKNKAEADEVQRKKDLNLKKN